jgi:hypothetical protein
MHESSRPSAPRLSGFAACLLYDVIDFRPPVILARCFFDPDQLPGFGYDAVGLRLAYNMDVNAQMDKA